MTIKEFFSKTFKRGTNEINPHFGQFFIGDWNIGREPFGKTVFISIEELLTNLANDVTFTLKGGDKDDFFSFKAFFDQEGQFVLNRLFFDGYVVVGKSSAGLQVLAENEYMKIGEGRSIYAVPINRSVYDECYVMRSTTFDTHGVSDWCLCLPFIKYLDNSFNASNTALERLGALVVASPKNTTSMPTPITLNKAEKEKLEQEIQKEYGSLSSQKAIMVLPREMNFDVISLATLDTKTNERARLAILAICDKLKVPANQVAIIDANSSKALSNGSELREGDFAKYQSFERLLNATFVRMAKDMRLSVDYTIYNKPERNGSN